MYDYINMMEMLHYEERALNVHQSVIFAVRTGKLERVRELINSFGLSYSQAWSEGYFLLCVALEYDHGAVAKLLLTSGSKINSKSRKLCNTPLHFAVKNGDIEIVKMLLDKGAKIDAKNQNGRTSLHTAIENKKIEVTELLLKYGSDVNARDNDGTHPLHIAAERGCLQTVENLLKYGAYVNCGLTSMWNKDYSPLHFAVETGNKEIVTLLLSSGANVDVKGGGDDITPLHIATKKGYISIAEVLLKHGAYIYSLTLNTGYTPLHFASELDNEEAVMLFLNRGADINVCSKNNSTPLHLASFLGDATIVKLLLQHGADINASTKDNLTPLHTAVRMRETTVVKLLLQHGAKVDNQDTDGETILHLAVKRGCLTIVEDLLKYCPDINNQSNKSSLKTAVYSCGKEYKKIVEALLEYGFSVNPEDANNSEFLHAAAKNGCLKIVDDLLKNRADVNILLHSSTSVEGFTLLHSAVRNKQEDVAKLLISYGAKIKDDLELLHTAVKKECLEIVEALLQHGADINACGTRKRTAIHFIGETESPFGSPFYEKPNINIKIKIAELLISKGADVNAKQRDRTTALHVAAQNGVKEIVTLLLECGAKVNSKTRSSLTPLHLAAEKGYRETIEILLKFGADVNSRDRSGRTALHYVSREGHKEVVQTLLDYGADINITNKDIRTPLELAMSKIRTFYNKFRHIHADFGSCPQEEIVKVLTRHIIKMKIENLYVSEKNLQPVTSNEFFDINNFQEKCAEEIESMKREKINNALISFYDIMSKSTSLLAICLENENIVQVLKSDVYKTKFPIYASMIESNFKKGMERKELLEQASKIFHFLFNNCPLLPHICTDKIFSYFNDEDLQILMVACKPLSTNNTNTK